MLLSLPPVYSTGLILVMWSLWLSHCVRVCCVASCIYRINHMCHMIRIHQELIAAAALARSKIWWTDAVQNIPYTGPTIGTKVCACTTRYTHSMYIYIHTHSPDHGAVLYMCIHIFIHNHRLHTQDWYRALRYAHTRHDTHIHRLCCCVYKSSCMYACAYIDMVYTHRTNARD